jgi:VanZ family protein
MRPAVGARFNMEEPEVIPKPRSPVIFPLVFQTIWLASIAFVTYLSLSSTVNFPLAINNIDKVYHSLAYLWLATIPFAGFERFKTATFCAFLMIPLGIIMEYVQRFVDGRFFSVGDMIANTIGVALGIALGGYLKARRSARETVSRLQ